MRRIDITPSPRILRMLGQINFSAFQCICELIDNSLDSFDERDYSSKVLEINNSKLAVSSNEEIRIKIPKLNSDFEANSIIVQDNGKGMDDEQLENSLKAGFSSNNPVDKMGLFGMGFNIATARLGEKTEIFTTRKEDNFIYKVSIDFRELERSGNFIREVEVLKKDTDERYEHGTKIVISKLNREHVKPLRQKTNILRQLGKTYGRILRKKGINLIYEDSKCTPFMHCTWNATRTGKDNVPTVIKIDEVLDEKKYCNTCWTWLFNTDIVCPSCGKKDNLSSRERRIKGWIGLQRFFSEDHYGFDLIRNGRVIRSLEKDLFYWIDENGQRMKEYPIDGFQAMGRFVGELEIDFVQVTHQKDSFETSSIDWQDFVRIIRGQGPIQPMVAKRHKFEQNKSPLARLFGAYRAMKAGKANFVPAREDGKALIRDSVITDYKTRFFENETAYITDEKWWELIVRNESPNLPSNPLISNNTQTGGNPFSNIAGTSQTQITQIEVIEDKTNELFELDENLSGTYSIDIFKNVQIKVEAERAKSGTHERGFTVSPEGLLLIFKYWPNSKIFEETFLRPEDLLVNELAFSFFQNVDLNLAEAPLSITERSLKKKYFPYLHPEIRQIDEQIQALVRNMKDHLKEAVRKIDNFDISLLSENSINQVIHRISQTNLIPQHEIQEALSKGKFIEFADLKVMVEIFKNYPSTLFDGIFFRFSINFDNLNQTISKNLIKDALINFEDIIWWQENGNNPSTELIWKGKSRRVIGSLEVLEGYK